jgi:type VI secretion system protein ImpH
MVREDRTATSGLKLLRDLAEKPWRFDFFQALRRLECVHADRPRLGTSVRAADDSVHLGQRVEMTFAPSTIAGVRSRKDGPPRILVRFFGLFGPNGPLPLHLSDWVHERSHNYDDETFARFADMFHHRMLSLFFRAWANAQPTVSYDRPDADGFADRVGSLFGIGMPRLKSRDALPDRTKLFFAGHLSCQTRHPEGLLAMVRAFFGISATLREFVGEWIHLPQANRYRMGESPDTGCLGESLVVGARIWDCQTKFRIVLGPMDYDEFQRLLPGGESLPRLVALVRNYCGHELNWDVNMILRKEAVPDLRLGAQGRLGWTTWLRSRAFEEDAENLYLSPLEHVGS